MVNVPSEDVAAPCDVPARETLAEMSGSRVTASLAMPVRIAVCAGEPGAIVTTARTIALNVLSILFLLTW